MAKGAPTGQEPPATTARQAAKAARLTREAAALRANLHKRKAQARAQAQPGNQSCSDAGLPTDPDQADS